MQIPTWRSSFRPVRLPPRVANDVQETFHQPRTTNVPGRLLSRRAQRSRRLRESTGQRVAPLPGVVRGNSATSLTQIFDRFVSQSAEAAGSDVRFDFAVPDAGVKLGEPRPKGSQMLGRLPTDPPCFPAILPPG